MRREVFLSGFLLDLLVIGFLFSAGSFLVADSLAWSNGGFSSDPTSPDYGTHDWVAQHALDWLPSEEKQYILGNLASYLYGTELPDNGGAPDGIGDTTKHHVYYNSVGTVTDDAAVVRASAEYNDTQGYLKADDYVNAAKNAGIMTHYIADLAVFGHVMGAATDWGAEIHHSDYEDYVNARTSSYSAEFNSYLSFDGSLQIVSAYDAAENLAYDTTFDVDGPLTCVWMDQNYDWSDPTFKNRVGESLNLAVNYLTDVLHTLFQESIPDEAYISVPHRAQQTGYYCGPAALEMVFDFYGPDVSQLEIADAADTTPGGTYTIAMVRAGHFSNLSTSVGSEMPTNVTGYAARTFGYAALERNDMTMGELKCLIALGYPVIVLTTWHYRVAVGYNSTHITFQDSWWGSMYNMTYDAFDVDWDYASHWALLVVPWRIELSASANIVRGSVFNVTANIAYPAPYPFYTNQYPASLSNATIVLPLGLSLASGETSGKTVDVGTFASGDSASVKWSVVAEEAGTHVIRVEAFGLVSGVVPYSYTDRIGGYNQISIDVMWAETTPPTTTHDYDGLWHTEDFKIKLTATDDFSGVAETYYKVNGNSPETVAVDGQPVITIESADNTLEFWSVDNAGNAEVHRIIAGIKLDKTLPTGSVEINDGEMYTNSDSVTLVLTATDAVSDVFQVRYSNDGAWNDETWETASTAKAWTLPAEDGTKVVYYQVTDNAGLVSLTYSDTITLDTAAPAVSVAGPVSGYESKSSTLNVTWTGADETSGVSRYEVRLDDGAWSDVGSDLSYTLAGLSEGAHTFYVRATDNAGNEVQESVAFVVNTSPLLGPGYMEEVGVAAVLIAVVLGIIAYVMSKRG